MICTSLALSTSMSLRRSEKHLKLRSQQEPRLAHEIIGAILVGRIVIEPRHVECQLQVLLARQEEPVHSPGVFGAIAEWSGDLRRARIDLAFLRDEEIPALAKSAEIE